MTASIMTDPEKISRQEQKRQLEHHFAENFDSLTYPLLADIYISEGQISRAKKVCLIGLDRHPNHPSGLYLAATLAIRDGDLAAAEKFLLQALQADEYHVGAAELLVAVRERLNRKKPILEQAYRKLLHANPLSRAAHERLDHLLAEKKMLEDIRRDLAGLPPEEAGIVEKPIPPPPAVPTTEPALPAEPTPIIPTDPAAADLSWEDNVRRLAEIMAANNAKSASEAETIATFPSDTEAPPQEGTALADLEEITEEEPIVAETDQEVFEVPTVEKEDEIDWTEVDTTAEEAGPDGESLETEITKQSEAEVFEPGLAAESSPSSEREQDLLETSDQAEKESGFDPGPSDLMETDEVIEPTLERIDEENLEDVTYTSETEPEIPDDSALIAETDQFDAEEATLIHPDIVSFGESVEEKPEDLEDDIKSLEATETGEPVSAVEKQEYVDEHIELIDDATNLLVEEETGSVTDETISGEMLADVSQAVEGESVVPEPQREEESFEPGAALGKEAPPPSAGEQEARAEEPYQPEGRILPRDTAREKEFLEDYAEPSDLGTDKHEISSTMEELPKDEEEAPTTDLDEAPEDPGAVEVSFDPGTENDQAETDVDELAEETVPILSQVDDLPAQPVVATTEGAADLSVEQAREGYPEIDEDGIEEEAPVSPSMTDEGAAYWAESLDSEETSFEPLGDADTVDEADQTLEEQPISESVASEEIDEFEPGEAMARPETDVLGDEVDQLVPIDGEPSDADMKESAFPEADMVEIETDTEAEKTETDEERESFEPGTASTDDESFLSADEADTTSQKTLDQEDLPADRAASQRTDEQEHDLAEEKIEEVEIGKVETSVSEVEMQTGEQEQVEGLESGEDSFEPAPMTGEDKEFDTNEFIDTDESTPASEHEQPYSHDIQTPMEDMKDIHLDEADVTGEAASEEMASDESESEIDYGEQLSSEELKTSLVGEDSEESETFEPGEAEPEASAPESMESAYTGSSTVESDEDETFEPGQRATADESDTEAVGKDHDTAKDVPAEEGKLPEEDASESELAGSVTSPPEGEDKPKDQFEPGELVSGETAPIPDEGKPADTQETAPDLEEREWDAEPAASKASIEEGDLPDIAILREEQHQQEEEVPIATGAEEEGYLEEETVSAQEIEGQDSASSIFAPGESTAEEDEAGLGTPDSHAAEEDAHVPYAPDWSTVDVSREDDLKVLEKAAYDSQEMQGESFKPSTRVPTREDVAPESPEDAELIFGDDVETEPVLEEERGDMTESQWLDPKLATFTLATIYKVQGLYQQALQVLDLLEDKGADSDRITAERDAILHQMGSPRSDED
jgi:tetratricopeptide (TPR) repeat protein